MNKESDSNTQISYGVKSSEYAINSNGVEKLSTKEFKKSISVELPQALVNKISNSVNNDNIASKTYSHIFGSTQPVELTLSYVVTSDSNEITRDDIKFNVGVCDESIKTTNSQSQSGGSNVPNVP